MSTKSNIEISDTCSGKNKTCQNHVRSIASQNFRPPGTEVVSKNILDDYNMRNALDMQVDRVAIKVTEME